MTLNFCIRIPPSSPTSPQTPPMSSCEPGVSIFLPFTSAAECRNCLLSVLSIIQHGVPTELIYLSLLTFTEIYSRLNLRCRPRALASETLNIIRVSDQVLESRRRHFVVPPAYSQLRNDLVAQTSRLAGLRLSRHSF